MYCSSILRAQLSYVSSKPKVSKQLYGIGAKLVMLNHMFEGEISQSQARDPVQPTAYHQSKKMRTLSGRIYFGCNADWSILNLNVIGISHFFAYFETHLDFLVEDMLLSHIDLDI